MDPLPMGGVQLPAFQRRLSRLYNDTKKSSDFVKEPARHGEGDPEIRSLHRKLRIQKDRLVSWGLEWSDPAHAAEVLIDSSLSRAGLSEVVGSIMSTIKDILAEAEPLWNSSRGLAGERVPEEPPRPGEKIRMVVWDKARFEDLLRDLTTSIDTLYDLSRTRSSYALSPPAARGAARPAPPAEELRPFESSRIQAPRQVDPAALTTLRSMQAEPMTEGAEPERAREIVFLSRQAHAELAPTSGARTPLLLEHAPFDPIFSATGIGPPMERFERLATGLQSEPQRSPGSWTGLPRLLAYYEDMDRSRFGLVYQFPRTFNPVTFEHLTQNPLYNLCTLADLLARPDFEPKLEAKFRLAANLANTVFDMHDRGITHGNLVGENISFCNAVGTDPEISGITQGEVDIRRPLLSSFDLFSDPRSPDAPRTYSLYRHPLDPRNSAQSPLAHNADSKTFDLYSLAMILLSVGLWTKLENLVADPESSTLPESVLEQLAIRCGTLYMKAVQTCWSAVDQELTGSRTTEEIVSRVQFRTSRYLEACCILDGVSNLEDRLGDDLGEPRPEPAQPRAAERAGSPSAGPLVRPSAEPSTGPSAGPSAGPPADPSGETAGAPAEETQVLRQAAPQPARRSRMRLYPHVPLPPEMVERWNTVFMPQINSALRHFYRRHPESVEISLESIGESPQRTRPTVLVVCTSVAKVRAILKKQLGGLFDGPAGLALKVCRGRVLRSRGDGGGRPGHDEAVAANPDYQARPANGASIGAWIGDRHLPPVSLGGLVVVDDRPYGMTVHHMLDDPDQAQAPVPAAKGGGAPQRSMARGGVPDLAAWYAEQYQQSESGESSSGAEDYACVFSDSDSDTLSESAVTSDYSDEGEDDDDQQYAEEGDIPGIEPGCGDGYIVTQPALDDVPDGFYPSAETQDEDHLDTCAVGEVYASSGIRRRTANGLLHEIDWALFEFSADRAPAGNFIPRPASKARRAPHAVGEQPADEPGVRPTSVAPSARLPGLEVQCMARTSGLQTGLILPAVASVKIYGRASPSQFFQVAGTPPPAPAGTAAAGTAALPMGIPGDSGAWVVERAHGAVCGHILAWSERKRVAYICPMDVLLLDIAETLGAREVRLPGGDAVFSFSSSSSSSSSAVRPPAVRDDRPARALTQLSSGSRLSAVSELGGGGDEEGDDEGDDAPALVGLRRRQSSRRSQLSHRSSYRGRRSVAVPEDDDLYDEAVEVELAGGLKELQVRGQEIPVGTRRWGFV
ncbi:1726f9c0-0770-45de-a06e-95c3b02f45ec [Thermothielavioides terrestris]|uniref:1726f9c0-0770-45de-a06e-95c3b02f45ec n=1 Tax=Thermothielavioides terrestris TaxID=2587410 RepID=A0A446BKU2_9PEZI|nr:1726f9c0-0770-45de-a06e-95c3b02f45ec [Thermothielavioides terrestris]